jgi:hypothetical protein
MDRRRSLWADDVVHHVLTSIRALHIKPELGVREVRDCGPVSAVALASQGSRVSAVLAQHDPKVIVYDVVAQH